MATSPVTYRVSPEVDAELRRLAGIHKGVDKALRVVFGWLSPVAATGVQPVSVESVAKRQPRKTRRKSETPSPELTKALDTLLPEQKGATDMGGGRKIWRH